MRSIETERLLLRNFSQNDDDAFFDLINNYNNSPMSKHDHEWPKNNLELLNVLNWFCTLDDYLAVIVKNENKIIGTVNITKENTPNNNVYNLGYIFHSEYHGYGYAYEACNAYIKYICENNKVDLIITGTSESNINSCKLLEKLGFKSTQKEKTSFQKDSNSNPIDFMGIMYKYIISNI